MFVARSCTIFVVDENGKPWANAKVGRGWAYGSSETSEERFTGPDGTLAFNAQTQAKSLFGRCLANVANVLAVHGSAHIDDEYLVGFPTNYTAKIDSEAPFKWVYDQGGFAKIDLGGLARNQHYQAKFILIKKSP